MTALSLSQRDRRALIGGAACIGVVLVIGRAIPAARRWDAREVKQGALVKQHLERDEQLVRQAGAMHDSLGARQRRLRAFRPALVRAETVAGGAAMLASLVSGAAMSSDLKMGALEIHVDSSRGGVFAPVAVGGSATGDIRGLATFLATLERGPARLAIRSLEIAQPQPDGPATQAEALRIVFTVEALVGPGAQVSQ